MSFAKLNFVEAQTDVATLDLIRLDNPNLDEPIDITSVNAIPQFFGYTNKFRSDSTWSYSYTIMNKAYSNLRFRIHQENIPSGVAIPEDTINIISHNYNNRDRDDWLGFGLSRKLNERWGIGVTTFLTLKSQDLLRETEFLSLQKNEKVLYNPQARFSSQQELQLRSTGLVWKIGVFHKTKNTNFGLSITTARLNIPILNNYVRETIYRDVDASDVALYQNTAYRRKSVYKTPTSIEFGLMQKVGTKHFVYFRKEYFAAISPYQLIKHNDENEANNFFYSTPQQAAKATVNFAFAYEYVINNSMTWMAGFRTDFNYFDETALHKTRDFVPSLGFWDLYHLSTGSSKAY